MSSKKNVVRHNNAYANKPARTRLHDTLTDMLTNLSLPPNSRIVESKLSKELGTSRTPLREALLKLEQEGLVKSDLAKGFTASSLSSWEVKELYPIIWTLESLAIDLAGKRLLEIVKDLESLNADFAKSKGNPTKMVKLDISFHQLLTKPCRNTHLIKQLTSLKKLVQRYEIAYMSESSWLNDSVKQHQEIIDSLKAEDYEMVKQVLKDNWRFGMERISSWLEWREKTGGQNERENQA